MARKFFRRFMPARDKVEGQTIFRWLKPVLDKPYLWQLNRRSVARGVSVGIFWAFIPIFGQTVPAAIMAWRLRGNVPLSIAATWLSNPFTLVPHWWAAYHVGRLILQQPRSDVQFTWAYLKDKVSFTWLAEHAWSFYVPLLVGSLLMSVVLGAICYFGILAGWRWAIAMKWKRRSAPAGQPPLA